MKKEHISAGVAGRLTGLQKASGLSVEAFGLKHGAKRSAQFMYQRGESLPDLLYLLSVAKACNVTLQWLVFGDAVSGGGELTDEERTVVERYRALPSAIRNVVESVLLLAWLASDSRRNYHQTEEPVPMGMYPVGPAAPALAVHEPTKADLKAKPAAKGGGNG